ncbi:Beta-1,3-galactosyltransferase 1 [Lamellibrachia satsuma]|nr:Beta-1,3-galactosyltransferase 1 [Lamellibrachia satsuma]
MTSLPENEEESTPILLPATDPPFTGPRRFNFSINEPFVCSSALYSPAPFLLVEVHSHALYHRKRKAIRGTWGRISRDYFREKQVRLVFILGNVDGTKHKLTVLRESRSYRDVISADVVDTYRNLTLKSLAGLYWAQQFCQGAKYLLKTDDDVYFNVSSLMRWLEMPNSPATEGITGSANMKSYVDREGKWKVDERLYPSKTYPRYCSGCAYLLTLSMAARLFNASHRVPLLPIEDVYITGLLANAVGTACVDNAAFPNYFTGPFVDDICEYYRDVLFAVHNVYYSQMYAIYNRILPAECYIIMPSK